MCELTLPCRDTDVSFFGQTKLLKGGKILQDDIFGDKIRSRLYKIVSLYGNVSVIYCICRE